MNTSIRNILASIALLALASVPAIAQDETFLEGSHYETLNETQAVSTGDKIEVLELFWYRCPHCNTLEVPLQEWLKNGKPENAQYIAFPAVLSSRWEPEARAFYTLEALGILDELHGKMFYAIHSEHRQLSSADKLADWAEEQGHSAQDVLDTYESFAVNTKLNYAKTMTKKYNIQGVPAVIVDGKYRTSVSQAGDADTLFEVINFLVEKSAAERG
jgi:thiol:disulfide interchange protein DsbA